MNQCKDKKKHKWTIKLFHAVKCEICKRVKWFASRRMEGRKYALGAFGQRKPFLHHTNMNRVKEVASETK